MISKDKDDKLVRIYFYICVDSSDKFKELQFYCERFSNNSESTFTDQEIMTLYLYTMHPEGHTKVKHIHRLLQNGYDLGSQSGGATRRSMPKASSKGVPWTFGAGLTTDH